MAEDYLQPLPMPSANKASTSLPLATLSALLTAIASAKDKTALFKTIMAELQPQFGFHDVGLFVVNKEEDYHVDLAANIPEISPSDLNTELHSTTASRLAHQGSVIDWVMSEIAAAGEPVLFDFQELTANFPKYPQFDYFPDTYRDCLASTLKVQGETLGMFCINALEKDKLAGVDKELFQTVADQIAVALSSILSQEQLMEEKQFKETLLSISEAVVAIQDRKQLLKTIYHRIKPIFPYDSFGLFALTEDRQYHYELIDADINSSTEQAVIEDRFGVHHRYFHPGSTIEEMMKQGPDLFLVKDHIEHPMVPIMYEAGLRQMIGGPLIYGSEKIGMLSFNSKREDFYTEQHLPMFEAISKQLSVATANVLANERLVEEKRFKETLLKISEATTQIRNREQLFEVVTEKIKPFIPFDDAVVVILTDNGKKYKHILTVSPEARKDHPLYAQVMERELPTENSPTEEIIRVEDGTHFRVEDWLNRYPDHPGLNLMKETELHHSVTLKLRQGGEVFGVLLFHFREEPLLNDSLRRLYSSIADQMSVAVSNVLANESLVAETHFKETLLEISEAVTQIRDREGLYAMIKEKVYPIIRYADAAVATFSDDYRVMTNVLILSAAERISHPLYHEVVHQPLVIEQGMPQEFLDQKDVSHHALEALISFWPDSPGLQLMKETGLVDSIVLRLRSGDEVFGLLTFHFTTFQTLSEQDEALYLSVADQLAVAVSNVLANEKILEREQEKAELLQISETVSTIRDREDLVRFLSGTAKSRFGYKNASITVNTPKPDTITLLCTDASEAVQRLEIYQILIASEYLLIPLTRRIMADTKVHTYYLEDLKKEYGDMVGVQLMGELNLNVSLATSLVSGGKAFGYLEFHFENEEDTKSVNQNLFKNIANQIAVAVSNILANERVREREREKTLQVEVISALNQGRNWKDKLRRAAQQLRTQIPFSQISFGASQYSDSFPNYGFEQIGPDEYRTLKLADFFRMSNMTPETLAAALSQRAYRQTTIVNTATLREGIQENALEKAIWEVFGTRSFIVVPITLKEEEGMYVVLYSRQENFYQDEHRQLLDSIRSSFGLALEKHLNYEKIQELNDRLAQEKSYLEEEIKTHYNFGQIVGESSALQEVFTQINRVAPTDATVLIQGETGTGKELIARALHENSPRNKQSLIKVNCAALPAQLIESELFGHEKGAFTGATQRRIGKFELAHGSTIFLDEIGELPLELQGKLLRVLQEKEFERLGSNQVRQVDVRVVAATNRNLAEEIRKGDFRQDLYFRLNVFPLQLPPLRERSEDIPLLAHFFVQKYTSKFKKRLPPLRETQLQELASYSWPGNVRELEHTLERAVIQASSQIDTLNLPQSNLTPVSASSQQDNQEYVPRSWRDTEVEVLIRTLRYCHGKVRGAGGAAQLLGLHPNTLESRMKKLGIKRQHTINK